MSESKIEGWIMYSNGSIDKDCSGAGMIYGVHYASVDCIINELINYFGDYFSDEFPEDYELNGDGCISFELTNISFFEGQMSFPETGQWDIAPHWEFDAKITKHEKWENEI